MAMVSVCFSQKKENRSSMSRRERKEKSKLFNGTQFHAQVTLKYCCLLSMLSMRVSVTVCVGVYVPQCIFISLHLSVLLLLECCCRCSFRCFCCFSRFSHTHTLSVELSNHKFKCTSIVEIGYHLHLCKCLQHIHICLQDCSVWLF